MREVEFIELANDRYLVVGSNNVVVSKKEMLKIKKDNSVLKDFYSNKCQKEETKKRKKIEKELAKVETETEVIKETK